MIKWCHWPRFIHYGALLLMSYLHKSLSLNSCVTGWKVSEEQQQHPDVSIGHFNNLVTGQIITILKQQHWSQSQLEQSSLLWPRLVPLVLQ